MQINSVLFCEALAIGARGQEIDFRAGQIGTVSPTAHHRLDVFIFLTGSQNQKV